MSDSVSKETSSADQELIALQASLRWAEDCVKADLTTFEKVQDFALQYPERDIQRAIKASKSWLDESIAKVDKIKGFIEQKRIDANKLAFVMGLRDQPGQQSMVHQLPEVVVEMICSNL